MIVMMTQEKMNELVPRKLREIEAEYDVEVLWAVESGSRAWGFASSDSDFDVRFIYKHRGDYYVELDPKRDVIEVPIDEVWDVSGWDLDKTLRLLYKSNPTLFEWFNSPIVYVRTDIKGKMQDLLAAYFSPKRCTYHYLNTAKNNYKAYLLKDEVIPKKYFYCLRPILCCRWIEKYQNYATHTNRPSISSPVSVDVITDSNHSVASVSSLGLLDEASHQDSLVSSGTALTVKGTTGIQGMGDLEMIPPVLFDDLVKEVLPEELKDVVEHLLELKMNMPEKATIKPIRELQSFLEAEMARFDEKLAHWPEEAKKDWSLINQFFKAEL